MRTKVHERITNIKVTAYPMVSHQNGKSPPYIIVEIYHSGRKLSNILYNIQNIWNPYRTFKQGGLINRIPVASMSKNLQPERGIAQSNVIILFLTFFKIEKYKL